MNELASPASPPTTTLRQQLVGNLSAQTATFEGHPVRDAWWTVLVYASLWHVFLTGRYDIFPDPI